MFFQGAFFLKFWPYVWLVFSSGFKSREGYDGAHMVVLYVGSKSTNRGLWYYEYDIYVVD
jgi:hypothetical protein